MTTAHINRIGTAVPPNDVHAAFVNFVQHFITERRDAALFKRMVGRAGIEHRYSFFTPVENPDGFVADTEGFYTPERFPRYRGADGPLRQDRAGSGDGRRSMPWASTVSANGSPTSSSPAAPASSRRASTS